MLKILSLFLALLLLAGCGAADTAQTYVIEQVSEPEEEISCFADIEYIRPQLEDMYAELDNLHELLDSYFKFGQIISSLEKLYYLRTNFDTMYALADIRACLDLADEYYDAEYTWCMEADAEVQMLIEEMYSACANSVHGRWLEIYCFWDGFCDEYRLRDEGSTDEFSEQYLKLVEREVQLLAQYRDIISAKSIEVDGETWSLEEYVLVDQTRAYELYYEKYNPVLARIYAELIVVRQDIAALMGYESYADYAYDALFTRDYSSADAMEYTKYIKEHLIGLVAEFFDSGLAYNVYYDSVDQRDLELYLETLAEGFGGRIDEAYRFMKYYTMYDISMAENKAEFSFQTYLDAYNAPYLFMHPYGYTDDIMTLCHEFGHYADAYIRENAYESIDLAEVYSMAMQLLAAEQLRCLMTEEEYSNYMIMNMQDILFALQEQTMLAEFELRAHELKNPDVETLNALYLEVLEDYGLMSEWEELFALGWVDVSHLFESPFYVISYPVASCAALEIYEMELEEKGSGADCFITMSESLISGLMEALDYVGLEDPLSEDSVKHMAEFIRGQLGL